MDFRTKLAFALVGVSLGGMLLLGVFSYETAANLLRRISERQLDALAESKADDLEETVESWRDQVRLIRSRTQLRISLEEYAATGDRKALDRVRRIAQDAESAVQEIKRITVFDADGRAVASAGRADAKPAPGARERGDPVTYSGLHRLPGGLMEATFHSALELDGRRVGSIQVVMDLGEIAALANDYTGLGDTGETIVVATGPEGELEILHPLRHAASPQAGRPDADAAHVAAALAGAEGVLEVESDYRGERTWAASRFVPDVEWGVIVKLDEEEELARVRELRDQLLDVTLALAAFAIAVGTAIGFRLAKPIRELSHTVDRVREGETELRAPVEGEDEVAHLARAINELLDEHDARERKRSDGGG